MRQQINQIRKQNTLLSSPCFTHKQFPQGRGSPHGALARSTPPFSVPSPVTTAAPPGQRAGRGPRVPAAVRPATAALPAAPDTGEPGPARHYRSCLQDGTGAQAVPRSPPRGHPTEGSRAGAGPGHLPRQQRLLPAPRSPAAWASAPGRATRTRPSRCPLPPPPPPGRAVCRRYRT